MKMIGSILPPAKSFNAEIDAFLNSSSDYDNTGVENPEKKAQYDSDYAEYQTQYDSYMADYDNYSFMKIISLLPPLPLFSSFSSSEPSAASERVINLVLYVAIVQSISS